MGAWMRGGDEWVGGWTIGLQGDHQAPWRRCVLHQPPHLERCSRGFSERRRSVHGPRVLPLRQAQVLRVELRFDSIAPRIPPTHPPTRPANQPAKPPTSPTARPTTHKSDFRWRRHVPTLMLAADQRTILSHLQSRQPWNLWLCLSLGGSEAHGVASHWQES